MSNKLIKLSGLNKHNLDIAIPASNILAVYSKNDHECTIQLTNGSFIDVDADIDEIIEIVNLDRV